MKNPSSPPFLKIIPLPFIALPLFAFFIILMRWRTYNEPVMCDITLYATFAHELLNGRHLYSDLWDDKPPAIFLTFIFGELIAGYGKSSLFFLNVLASITTLLGVYKAGTLLGGRKVTGILAAFLWVLLSGDLLLEADQPNVEVFINAVTIWIFNLWSMKPYEKLELWKTLALGSLCAFDSLYKHYLTIMVILLALGHWALAGDKPGKRTAFLQTAVIGLTGLFFWALTFLYFSITGRFGIFLNTLFAFDFYYAHISGNEKPAYFLENIMSRLSPGHAFPHSAAFLLPLFLVSMVGLIFNCMKKQRPWFLYAFLVLSTFLAIVIPGKFFNHYYQLWLPVLPVGAAWSLEWAWVKGFAKSAVLAGVLSIAVVGKYEWQWMSLTPIQCSQIKYGDFYIYQESVSRSINDLLLPGETFYEWGALPDFYLASGRRLPVGNILGDMLFGSKLAPELTEKVLSDLETRKPELMVLDSLNKPWRWDIPAVIGHPVTKYLFSHYTFLRKCNPENRFQLWMRSGGALEKRIRSEQAYQPIK